MEIALIICVLTGGAGPARLARLSRYLGGVGGGGVGVLRLPRVLDHRHVARLAVHGVGHGLQPAVGQRHVVLAVGEVAVTRLLRAEVVVAVVVLDGVLPGVEGGLGGVGGLGVGGGGLVGGGGGGLVHYRGGGGLVDNGGGLVSYRGGNGLVDILDSWPALDGLKEKHLSPPTYL